MTYYLQLSLYLLIDNNSQKKDKNKKKINSNYRTVTLWASFAWSSRICFIPLEQRFPGAKDELRIEGWGYIRREYGLVVDPLLLFSDDDDDDDELPPLSLFWIDVCVLCRI